MADFNAMIDGYHRFRETGYSAQRERWEGLSQGQSPSVMVIACSDSRVDPSQIFDTSPGEIFVVRNVANLVPPYESDGSYHGVSAAIEFAVTQLKVSEIVVMGHAACGGVHASLSQRFAGADHGHGGFIHHWIEILDEARDKVIEKHGETDEGVRALEHEGIRVSLNNLRTFPFVTASENAGTLKLTGAFFSIHDGVLHVMDKNGVFNPA